MSNNHSRNHEIPFEEAIELLSNSYRREILRLITLKERYAFELSKLLEISQRAVSNHLNALHDAGLVESEKKKSDKGPDREYYKLNKSVVLSLTLAPNLFLATLRNLDETASNRFATITPELQLGSSQRISAQDVIEEGLELLPQIREGLELLESQQSKLLRGYQGLRNHISEVLEKAEFSSSEIRVLLLLIENDGEMSLDDIAKTLNVPKMNVNELVNPLIQKSLITAENVQDVQGNLKYYIKLVQKSK